MHGSIKPVQLNGPWPRLHLAAWYAASVCNLLILPTWKFALPLWQLPSPRLIPFACLTTAFVASAGIAFLLRTVDRGRALWLSTVVTLAIFGIVFLGFIGARTDFSRATTLLSFAYAITLIPAPYAIGGSRKYRAAAFIILVTAGVMIPFLPSSLPAPQRSSALIKTEYYNLSVETFSGAFPKSSIVGGGLARVGNSYLRLSGDGHLYLFGWEGDTDQLTVAPLPYRVPINGDEFAAAAGQPWERSAIEAPQENMKVGSESEGLHTEWFRTYGLLTQEIGSQVRVFVSHDYWKAAQYCWVERVSMLELDRATMLRGAAGPEWRTLYETSPCLPVRGEGRRRGVSFVGYFGGGRMALLDPQTLLLTVGDFGFDGVASDATPSQDPASSYGKTIAINIADGHGTLFTLGHRNPQGLFIDQSGTIWSTEHGPQGGDELNQLVRGRNYGWPFVTYGTDYGSFSWPLNKPESPETFQTPTFAWVPSIGVSNLLAVRGELFSHWRGDLLIGSLRAQTLFRACIREGHVAYLEPIELGSRIRDLVEGPDGRIVVLTDADLLDSIRPKDDKSGEALFAEKCSGCHDSRPTEGQKIGPNLFGVVGRKVATFANQATYSPALRQLGGVWTEARLDLFLKAPREFSPGTAMDYAGDANSEERGAIIRYLQSLR
jgi:cytochrome c2